MSLTLRFGGRRARGSVPRAREREERDELLARLRRDAERIADRFGLRYRAIEAENGRVKRRYGSCHSDGVIKIRLRHVVTGRPLKYSSLVATLCHELAHLKHFHHGPSFRDFNEVVLDWARREGIYLPDGPGSRRPGAGRRAPAPAGAEAGAPAPAAAARTAPAAPIRAPGRAPEPEQLGLF